MSAKYHRDLSIDASAAEAGSAATTSIGIPAADMVVLPAIRTPAGMDHLPRNPAEEAGYLPPTPLNKHAPDAGEILSLAASLDGRTTINKAMHVMGHRDGHGHRDREHAHRDRDREGHGASQPIISIPVYYFLSLCRSRTHIRHRHCSSSRQAGGWRSIDAQRLRQPVRRRFCGVGGRAGNHNRGPERTTAASGYTQASNEASGHRL
jgi:hypothetical protein